MCYDGDKSLHEDIRDAILMFPEYPADPGFAFATALAGDFPDRLAEFISQHVAERVHL